MITYPLTETVSIERVKANGKRFCVDSDKFYYKSKDYIKSVIGDIRGIYGYYSIFPMVQEMAKIEGIDVHKGWRFHDDTDVIVRITTAIFEAYDENPAEEYKQFTQKQWEKIVFNAWLAAAESDYWYEFEKDYGQYD